MSEKKEYIERGELIAFVREVRKKLPKDSKDFFTRDEMLLNFQQYLELQKAADVEPVVRCKDCVAYAGKERKGGGVMMICRLNKHEASPEHFCSQGRSGAHMERSGSGEKL
jgi:hypothetical protein